MQRDMELRRIQMSVKRKTKTNIEFVSSCFLLLVFSIVQKNQTKSSEIVHERIADHQHRW